MTGTRVIALGLGALGLGVGLSTIGYPPGEYGVPGPALFPRAVAIGLVIVAARLAASPDVDVPPLPPGRARAILWTLAALLLYVAVWDVVPFVPRTALLVVVFLRLLAVSWTATAVTAASLSLVVFFVFERLLAVRL